MKRDWRIVFMWLVMAGWAVTAGAGRVRAGVPGDANGDGRVDGADYAIWLQYYGTATGGGPGQGDFNNSGKVDGADYAIWLANYGARAPTGTPVQPTTKPTPPPTAGEFNFISFGDTEKSLTVLAQISNEALGLNPEFAVYTGDAVLGFPDQWKAALNGNNNNGLGNKTFASRGNGDSTNYYSAFNFSQAAANIGAKNYTSLPNFLAYSFDYGNSRFISTDNAGCGSPNSTQLAWLEERFRDAESGGMDHVFLFKHGTIWYVDNHPNCVPKADFMALISKYPVVTAIFTGHEHMKSAIEFGPNDSRIPMSHPFWQFTTSPAGDSTYPCNSSRLQSGDYCEGYNGPANITVRGKQVTVEFYEVGNKTPRKTFSFSK